MYMSDRRRSPTKPSSTPSVAITNPAMGRLLMPTIQPCSPTWSGNTLPASSPLMRLVIISTPPCASLNCATMPPSPAWAK